MKLKNYVIALASIAVASCSSSSEELIGPNPPVPGGGEDSTVVDDKIQLSFKTAVLDLTRNFSPELNALQLERGMAITLSSRNVTGMDLSVGNADSIVRTIIPSSTQYEADGDGNLFIMGGNSPLSYSVGSKVLLYSFPTASAVGIKSDQTSDKNFMASDYMIGLPTIGNPVTVSKDPITLQYTHALSKIIVNLKVNDFIGISPKLISCSIADSYVNFLDPNTSNPTNMVQRPEITHLGDSTEIVIGRDTTFATVQPNGDGDHILKLAGIIVPMKAKAGRLFIKLTCGNDIGQTTYTYRLSENINFESGKVYTFNLSPRFVDITASTVKNWVDGGYWDGDLTSDNKQQ